MGKRDFGVSELSLKIRREQVQQADRLETQDALVKAQGDRVTWDDAHPKRIKHLLREAACIGGYVWFQRDERSVTITSIEFEAACWVEEAFNAHNYVALSHDRFLEFHDAETGPGTQTAKGILGLVCDYVVEHVLKAEDNENQWTVVHDPRNGIARLYYRGKTTKAAA
jgi:hypothetical protein